MTAITAVLVLAIVLSVVFRSTRWIGSLSIALLISLYPAHAVLLLLLRVVVAHLFHF